MFLLLALMYPLAVQYEVREWRWLAPITLTALVVDVVSNYSDLAVLTWDFPRRGEYTFSQRLVRLQYGNRWQRFIARAVIPYLNYFDPGHVPTKNT